MQNPGFTCPESSSFLTDFVDKLSQDFLVEELVNCLLLNKLMMHQSMMIKEGDQHHFHFWERCIRAFFGLGEDALFHWRFCSFVLPGTY